MAEMRRIVICILSILLAAMPTVSSGEELWVSAAITLEDAFTRLGRGFEEKNRGARVIFNFGASGDLKNQIQVGAPVDIYAPAYPYFMDQLVERGLVIEETLADFAGNSMVLIQNVATDHAIKDFQDLADREIRLIAVGNPRSVSAGRYAKEILTKLNLWETLGPKLVLGENVRQTLAYVELGMVDAGIVFSSDAAITDKVKVVKRAPADTHTPILYPIGVLKDSTRKELAESFIHYVLSPEGQKIISDHGFEPVETNGR